MPNLTLCDIINYPKCFVKNDLIFQNFCLINKRLQISYFIFICHIPFIVYFSEKIKLNDLKELFAKYFDN